MILIDTNVLIALADRHEAEHSQTVRELESVFHRKLLLCWPVMVETFHFVRRPDLRAVLVDMFEQFDMTMISPGVSPTLSQVTDWLVRYVDHAPDFTDAYLVATSSINRKWLIWTRDSEFQTIWRRLDGSAIPLAFKG